MRVYFSEPAGDGGLVGIVSRNMLAPVAGQQRQKRRIRLRGGTTASCPERCDVGGGVPGQWRRRPPRSDAVMDYF